MTWREARAMLESWIADIHAKLDAARDPLEKLELMEQYVELCRLRDKIAKNRND